MGTKDSRVDAHIARSEDFAKPILSYIRKVVHRGCPEVEETIKWRFPHFLHKGILCSMASFQRHCAFGFWKEALLLEKHPALGDAGKTAMGQFGRITSLADLPGEKALLRLVRDAAALNEQGVRPARPRPGARKAPVIPDYFRKALRSNRKAQATFEGFSYTNKKDYLEWVTEAKGEETRRRRLETAVAWMAEGKIRNWKYVRR
jgi:uncharacterized protein YdeI (YjbR/CyaY-like superfamily)